MPDDELAQDLIDLEDDPLPDPSGEPDDEGQDPGGADEIEAQEGDDRDREQVLPSRRDARIQRLTEDNRALRASFDEVNRRLGELTARPPEQVFRQREETPAERAARYEGMSQGEAIAAALAESEARFLARMNMATVQTAEVGDKSSFDAKANADELYAHWLPKVETKLAELRRQGINMTREVLFTFMVGEAALEARRSKRTRGNRPVHVGNRGQPRRRVADTGSDYAPTSGVRRGGGDEAAARERRLANVPL